MNTNNQQQQLIQKNPSCQHKTLAQEFAYGAATGNYICIDCQCLLPGESSNNHATASPGGQSVDQMTKWQYV